MTSIMSISMSSAEEVSAQKLTTRQNNTEIVDSTSFPYRKERALWQADQVYTGYTLEHQHKRFENARNCPIYQIPTELRLETMRYLVPMDLYLLRQSCWLFLSTFADDLFSALHRPMPRRLDSGYRYLLKQWLLLSGSQYSAFHLRYHRQTPSQSVYPHTGKPIAELDPNKLSHSDLRQIKDIIRKQFLCDTCIAQKPSSEVSSSIYCNAALFASSWTTHPCIGCGETHFRAFFTKTELGKKNPTCIGWEGQVRLCPHQLLSPFDEIPWNDPNTFSIPCLDCQPLFYEGQGELCPQLSSNLANVLRLNWTMQVCRLTKGQLITKTMMRQGLEELEKRFGNEYLCPHLTFRDHRLMQPFESERCVCFREPRQGSTKCYRHKCGDIEKWDCCACNNLRQPDAVGKFMPSVTSVPGCHRQSLHKFSCRSCCAVYKWSVEGGRISLSRSQSLGELLIVQSSPRTNLARLSPNKKLMGRWILQLDPRTYGLNGHMSQHAPCSDMSCGNSPSRRTCWQTDIKCGGTYLVQSN